MKLIDRVAEFVANPQPLWNNNLTHQLVANKEGNLKTDYTLTNCILKNDGTHENSISLGNGADKLRIVLPQENIKFFFKDHGLTSLSLNDSFTDALTQVQQALNLFKKAPSIYDFIHQIVRSICLLKAESPEIDVSYSHPDIPFSIFVSVCERQSNLTPIRIAESVLHESMHLFLTLIEEIVPVVDQGSTETYFSPWRDEARPVKGVIHGLFVFRAILEFYKILKYSNVNDGILEFVQIRVRLIREEIQMLSEFPNSKGLTLPGKNLAFNLIQDIRDF
jgi:HEXXH motif-containing protein